MITSRDKEDEKEKIETIRKNDQIKKLRKN